MWNQYKPFVEEVWPEAEHIEPDVYLMVMASAHSICVAFAPVLAEGAPVPATYKLAEIFQARDIWSKFNGGNREEYGADGMAIPVYPLVFAARDLLRPKTSPLLRLR